ncbi:MarR family transcriptional regulator [Wukongibacter baidiensis]|uniref:MarR family winged helix-turn-helix transcriptional regulator n=1 Tax=Wukongibacter baidiensis TaxID=1723361 RepID=UPI003D7F5FFE
MKLNSHILREVGSLTRSIHAIVEVRFKELHLQKGQSIYLTRICEKPGINLIQLSSLLKVDKTTTTKVVQKLIKEDFILKRKDDDDKRSYRLYPTSKALRTYDELIKEENRVIDMCYRDLDEEQKKLAYELIRKMKENIETNWLKIKNYK